MPFQLPLSSWVAASGVGTPRPFFWPDGTVYTDGQITSGEVVLYRLGTGMIVNVNGNNVVNPDPPVLTSLSPTTAVHGGADLTLTCTGSGFISSSLIRFNGVDLTTTFVSSTSLTATISPSQFSAAATVPVQIHSGGNYSSVVNFSIT
jgi:hypothetical protein